MNTLLQDILNKCCTYIKDGKLANYIPELAKANLEDFGICIISDADKVSFAGDFDKTFTMQSVVKPIILLISIAEFIIKLFKQFV